MGDRGNIVVKQGEDMPSVWLYTHWSGSDIKEILQDALKRRQRWNDAPYLTRIIFDELAGGHVGGETGYGITTGMTDNEHPILVVDPDAGQVMECEVHHSSYKLPPTRSWSFEEFCRAVFQENEDQ